MLPLFPMECTKDRSAGFKGEETRQPELERHRNERGREEGREGRETGGGEREYQTEPAEEISTTHAKCTQK